MSLKARILVIDDEPVVCKSCSRILSEEGHEVEMALSGSQGLERIRTRSFDVVLVDLKMPDMSGMEVLKRIKEEIPEAVVLMITGYSTVKTAVEAMKLGASDYVPKPFTPDELAMVVQQALEKRQLLHENAYLRRELKVRYGLGEIVGDSEGMQEIYTLIRRVAPTRSTVLIYGESGTGKELIARAIHRHSERKNGPFVTADCGTFSQSLLESELFGHVKGAFTGATATRPGLFDIADGGTLSLDEVSNIPLETQSKLLRVLETQEFRPVGGSQSRKVDIRLIAATNRELKEMTAEGTFREDLFYRLSVFPITIPPLRERKEDIPALALHFLNHFSEETRKDIRGFTKEAMNLLMSYDWPGNVRELRNVIERLVIMADEKMVGSVHVPAIMETQHTGFATSVPKTKEELKEIKKRAREKAIEEIERSFVLEALHRSDWNVTKAAEDTGLQRQNFQALMRKYEIRSRGAALLESEDNGT